MFDITPPASGTDFLAAFERLHGEIAAAFGALPTGVFLAPQGSAWSPGDHLRHLTRSVRPVALALRLPGPVLRAAFGSPGHASRSFETIRAVYRKALAEGAQAGRYAPSPRPAGGVPEAWRARVTAHWERADGALLRGAARWPEASLDRYGLPHPALGTLTLREMLFFTLYHHAHHASLVMERAGSGR